MAFLRFYGYDFEVKAYAYFKVEHKQDRDEADTEAYLSVNKLYDNRNHIEVQEVNVTKIVRQKFFDFAEVKIGLKVAVTAHDYEAAYKEAEREIRNISLPVGVGLYEVDTYDYEWNSERVVGE